MKGDEYLKKILYNELIRFRHSCWVGVMLHQKKLMLMKKRYFLASFLALSLVMVGCGAEAQKNHSNNSITTDYTNSQDDNNSQDYNNLQDHDFVMLAKNMPNQPTSITWRNMHTKIGKCSFFTDVCTLNNEFPYGTAYYINEQTTSVTLQVTGKDIDETITISPQSSKGIVWEKSSSINLSDQYYLVTLKSAENKLLSGYFTLASSDGTFELWEEESYNSTRVYSDLITSKDSFFTTTIQLTNEQPFGEAIFINKQPVPVTMTITGKNREGKDVQEVIQIEAFGSEYFNWSDIPFMENASESALYTVTLTCDKEHTLNGYFTLRCY